MMGGTKPRFVARYMCSLEDPEPVRTWFIVDTMTGVPLADAEGILLFHRKGALEKIAALAASATPRL